MPLPATSFGSATAVAQAVRANLLQLCGINFDETILENIKSGKQACAIDQQGYLQGYLAVALLNGHVNYGLQVPICEIPTGPGITDTAKLEATAAGLKAGTR